MTELELDDVEKDHRTPNRCQQADQTNDSPDDDYAHGVHLFFSLLAVGLATVLVGYVSILNPSTSSRSMRSLFTGRKLRYHYHPIGHRYIQLSQ